MEITEDLIYERARKTLDQILDHVPNLKKTWTQRERQQPAHIARLVDFTVRIEFNHHVYDIAVVIKAQGFPQQLEQAIAQLLRWRHKANAHDQMIVAAPYITKEGAAVCNADNVSFFDLAGNCRIAMGPLYIERTGVPNPFQKNVMAAPSLYGTRGERILRILLADPQKAWRIAQLVEQAGVSAGTVSTARKLLIERDWAKETPDGILLTQPEKLLRDWATVWGRRAVRPSTYFTRLPLPEFEQQFAAHAHKQNRIAALTGAAGAWRYAPMTRYQRIQLYWDGEADELAQALDLKKTESGANVHILKPRDRGVFDFLEEFDGVPVVGPVQLYLDLQRDPARGQEAAEHLWQTKLFNA